MLFSTIGAVANGASIVNIIRVAWAEGLTSVLDPLLDAWFVVVDRTFSAIPKIFDWDPPIWLDSLWALSFVGVMLMTRTGYATLAYAPRSLLSYDEAPSTDLSVPIWGVIAQGISMYGLTYYLHFPLTSFSYLHGMFVIRSVDRHAVPGAFREQYSAGKRVACKNSKKNGPGNLDLESGFWWKFGYEAGMVAYQARILFLISILNFGLVAAVVAFYLVTLAF